ncbi:MAG: hypothetical protein KDA51_05510, partial [Planctomycetales bacterium]|nr:hypothetical protein [Planctomycetales bacterium]
MSPGDTLVLDGTYNRALRITQSGEEGAMITVMAATDGSARLVGDALAPCEIVGTSEKNIEYVRLIGLRCDAGTGGAMTVANAQHIELFRVTAYATQAAKNAMTITNAANILLEDIAAIGPSTVLFDLRGCDDCTVRRGFARWEQGTEPNYGFLLVNSSRSRIENSVAVDVGGNSFGFGIATNNS